MFLRYKGRCRLWTFLSGRRDACSSAPGQVGILPEAAEAIGQVARRPLPGHRRVCRRLGRLAIVVDEVRWQEGFSSCDGRDAVQAELGDEAILTEENVFTDRQQLD
jgi:hypothetical protein